MRKTLPFLSALMLLLTAIGCKKESDPFVPNTAESYFNLAPGKFIVYQVDSTVFTNSGRSMVVHHYRQRDLVDTMLTDGLGRPSWRIFRSITDSAGTDVWHPLQTYWITLTSSGAEVIEDNLRFVRLANPATKDNTWKGARFLGADPYGGLYTFSNDDNMADWDFTITATGEQATYFGQTYNDVTTVNAIDESINVPLTDPTAFGARSLSIDRYARGIGLVFQHFILWEYQPNPNGTPYSVGFGIERTILQHN